MSCLKIRVNKPVITAYKTIRNLKMLEAINIIFNPLIAECAGFLMGFLHATADIAKIMTMERIAKIYQALIKALADPLKSASKIHALLIAVMKRNIQTGCVIILPICAHEHIIGGLWPVFERLNKVHDTTAP